MYTSRSSSRCCVTRKPPASEGRAYSRGSTRSLTNLPNYAQPTISFIQHSNYGENDAVTFKAGKLRNKSRPSSVATVKCGSFRMKETTPQRVPSTSRYSTQANQVGYLTCKPTSSSYKAPVLIQKSKDKQSILLDKIRETDGLIAKLNSNNQLDNMFSHNAHDLKALVKDADTITPADWNNLVDYHFTVFDDAQKKIELDFKLIQNILELNNHISYVLTDYENKLRDAKDEISELKLLLSNFEHPVKQVSEFENITSPKPSGSISGISSNNIYLDIFTNH